MVGINDIKDFINEFGGDMSAEAVRSALNTLYPKEFELYFVSLELTDAEDNPEDFFTFPITPNSISKSEPFIKDIQRGFGAIVVNKTGLFAPQDITIRGNFGRDFKIIIRSRVPAESRSDNKTISMGGILRTFKPGEGELSANIKSGYGCLKVLQDICRSSDQLANGLPKRLYFHNFPLGESYLVEVLDFSTDMNMSNNMMWNYNLKLKIVAPVNRGFLKKVSRISIGQAQRLLNSGVKLALNYRASKPMRDSSDLLNFDTDAFFGRFDSLVNTENQSLVDYYTSEGEYPKDAEDLIRELENDVDELQKKTITTRESVNNYFAFMVNDWIEACKSGLESLKNYGRWLHSSFVDGVGKSWVETTLIQAQNQSLEKFSDMLGFLDRNQGAIDIAMRNNLREEDYTNDGGAIMSYSFQNDNVTMILETIIDYLVGENVLGKDIASKLLFVDNDLDFLKPRDTFAQTVNVLCGLMKNANPEFPLDGFDKSTLLNQNMLNNRLPTFIRQLYETVGRDDSIASFNILNINTSGEALSIEMEFISHLRGETQKFVIHGN